MRSTHRAVLQTAAFARPRGFVGTGIHILPAFVTMAHRLSTAATDSHGDLNNTSVMREMQRLPVDDHYARRSLAIRPEDDEPGVRSRYRPFIVGDAITECDWVSQLELSTITKMAEDDFKRTGERIKVLVLTGSLRKR